MDINGKANRPTTPPGGGKVARTVPVSEWDDPGLDVGAAQRDASPYHPPRVGLPLRARPKRRRRFALPRALQNTVVLATPLHSGSGVSTAFEVTLGSLTGTRLGHKNRPSPCPPTATAQRHDRILRINKMVRQGPRYGGHLLLGTRRLQLRPCGAAAQLRPLSKPPGRLPCHRSSRENSRIHPNTE